MIFSRRSFLTLAGASIAVPTRVFAEPHHVLDTPEKVLGLGDKGYLHEELHPYYEIVFTKWGCNCATGECRPTTFKTVAVSPEAPEGIIVLMDGEWVGVPSKSLHKEKDIVPKRLQQFDAHVCGMWWLKLTPVPLIECAWININS